ncbi:hypothetical protein PR048_012447 [Dryococelus australis]|uniref:Uncharacterized protein n=1 Tax=Dryococelus australis TaxID=614101 RepID=A0ABQ9HQT2_9NEOP|nr:hypothetical protein PR048_012447 [Dryococelus australis]
MQWVCNSIRRSSTWCSKKQGVVAQTTAESGFVSMAGVVAQSTAEAEFVSMAGVVAQSTAEAEFVSMAQVTKEIAWMKGLLASYVRHNSLIRHVL